MSGPYPDNGRDAYEDMSDFYRTRHDAECESELTSHGQTPCQCDERSGVSVITAHVCGGKQARVCRVTGKEHDMSAVVRFKDGGSVACKDCGVTAMQIDMMELP